MRSSPTSPLAVLVVALLLLSGPGTVLATGAPGPLDSTPDHQAGYWNTTLTDPSSNVLDLSVFYPARTAGEGTIKDVSGAPYPTLLIVHHAGYRPAFGFWRSYGEHLSQRGYVVGMVDLEPYDGSPASEYDAMVNATLAAVDRIIDLEDTSGSVLYGMVNTSAIVLAGHGSGAAVGLRAVLEDTMDRVAGLVSIRLLPIEQGTGPFDWGTGRMDIPVLLLEGSMDSDAHARDAFRQKAEGHVSLLTIAGANFTQFMDDGDVPSSSPPADINLTEQQRLAKKYLLAFLDFHFKDDQLAAPKLYGSQAAADLEDGTLATWLYGVRDQAVKAIAPAEGARLPTGPLDICATVTNAGPFPMPLRNVTLEVAKVLPGPVYQITYGPQNRSVAAQPVGTETTVGWTPVLTEYGTYVAILRMGDPDHNASNNRVSREFSVVPLLPPTISHDPPDLLELGEGFNISCRIAAPSGIVDAYLDYTDEDGYRRDVPLAEDPVTGDFYANLPAPLYPGQVTYRIHARAGNNATNATNPYYIAVVDTVPPAIVHVQGWTQLPVMSEVELNATVTDAGGIDQVRLLYNDPSSGSRNVTCGREGDRWFYPVVLGPVSGPLAYSWYALDSWGNEAMTGSYTIAVVDEAPPVIEVASTDPVELGDDLLLEARVTDGAVLDAVWVTYARPGATGEVNGTPDPLGDVFRLAVTNLTTAGTLAFAWWARDVNGQTSTSGPLSVDVMDTVPPVISDVSSGDAEVGLQPWVQAVVEDTGGLTSVTLEYTDVEGTSASMDMDEVLPRIFEARLPAQSRGGAITYRVVAVDPTGNRADTEDRTMVVRDLVPPLMSHAPPQDLVEGQEVTFQLQVTDNVGVAEVWLYLRLTATASWRRLAMEHEGGGVYVYTLEKGELSQPHVMYYFEAEDLPPSSNLATEPPGAPSATYLLNVTERQLRLHGIVRASGGDPIEGATVGLVGREDKVRTGKDGAFEFTGLVAGPYILEVRADGFEGMSTNLVLSAEAGDRELDVTLVPKRGTDGGDEGLPWTMIAALIIFALIALMVLLLMRSGTRGG